MMCYACMCVCSPRDVVVPFFKKLETPEQLTGFLDAVCDIHTPRNSMQMLSCSIKPHHALPIGCFARFWALWPDSCTSLCMWARRVWSGC
jgi:hypothetical protein